jgi:D-alanyl-D-alanine carboxypeptidase
MKKKQTKQPRTLRRILRIVLIIASISSLFFVPWILVKAWILPLPDTVQEQVDEAIGHGLDGMIVYVDEAGKPPAFYAAGWHDRKNKIPAYPQALLKDIDTIVIQFNNTTGGYHWNTAEIVFNRIVKILRSKKSSRL